VKITVLGATGQAGRHITRLLLDDESAEVTACARTATRLDALEAALTSRNGTLRTAVVDVESESEVERVVAAADLVVAATSRWSDAPRIASIAVNCSTAYFGIYLSNGEKWRRLRQLHDECVARNLMVVDDGGAHPGLPAVMIRRAREEGELRSAWVGAKFGLPWDELDLASETVSDFVEEIETTDPSILKEGVWVQGYRHARKFDFGSGSLEACAPMCLEEIRELGNSGAVPSAGFFIAGFGPLVDYGVFPLSMGLTKVSRRRAADLMLWGLRRWASARSGAVLVLEGERTEGSPEVRLRVAHADPYLLTAIPAVAAIHQMVRQPRPGVWTQAAFVNPDPFFRHLQEMGVEVAGPA